VGSEQLKSEGAFWLPVPYLLHVGWNCSNWAIVRPLPTAHCPLPTAHCPLPTAHCPLPTAHLFP